MAEQYLELWNKCLEIIKDNIGKEKFDTWFTCVKPVSYENKALTLELPSLYFKQLYSTQFYDILKKSLRRVFGEEVSLQYNVPIVGNDSASQVQYSESKQSNIAINRTVRAAQSPASPFAPVQYADVDSQLNEEYNFDNYCVGESNRLPFVIAEYIAKNPTKKEFNPFFLYGEVGVGKTHLIQAIGLHIKEQDPTKRVLYVTYRQFQNQVSTAYIQKRMPDFIRWYESIDVLLIDDLQEIALRDGTMNALFTIFNHLHQRGKNLIFTSDRAPVELDGITDRLLDRFKWGVVEKLPAPDFGLRKAILTFKAKKNGLSIPEEIINVIAEYGEGSVRQLEGIVMGILTKSIATNSPITVEMAKEVMSHCIKVEKRTINFEMIVEATAEHFHLNPDVVFSKSRVQDISDARQLIMYLARKHTQLSSSAIGAKLNRTHATVLHGIKTVSERIPLVKELSDAVETIEAELRRM